MRQFSVGKSNLKDRIEFHGMHPNDFILNFMTNQIELEVRRIIDLEKIENYHMQQLTYGH